MNLGEGRGKRLRLLLIVLGAGAALWLLESRLGSIDLEQVLDDVSATLGDFTYLLVGVFAFLETGAFVGLIAPGETVVMLAGAVAGQGETSIVLTIGIVWFAAWAGDSVSFLIGHRLGREFVMRHGPRVRITHERFAQVESYFQRHGGKTILIGRFIGLVRALAPFIAGSSGMRYRAFVPFSVLGTGMWATAFSLIGYFASRSLNEAAEVAGRGTLLFGITAAVIVGVVVAIRHLRVPENRARLVARMEANAALRPLVVAGRRVRTPARFLFDRITPGGLGLELTTAMAVLAVASYVLVAYTVTVSGDVGPTPGDSAALDAVRRLEHGWLTSVAKAVTALGSSAVTIPIAAIAAVALAVRRHWAEVAVLVVALVIVHVGVPVMKEEIARPRPPDPLVSAGGYAFPSGHAAYSMLYAWLAVTAAVRLRPGRAGGVAMVVVGIALAAVIGLSRVYLRVHWLSDVNAGWALGAGAFALCAMVAMIVTFVRQNERG